MNTANDAQSMVVSILCADDELQRFSRRLASKVNPSRLHLASVIAAGTQIYPFRTDSLKGVAVLLQCEFRKRNSGSTVTPEDAHDVLERLDGYQVIGATLLAADGSHIGMPSQLRSAS
jgi:hypothetical protein